MIYLDVFNSQGHYNKYPPMHHHLGEWKFSLWCQLPGIRASALWFLLGDSYSTPLSWLQLAHLPSLFLPPHRSTLPLAGLLCVVFIYFTVSIVVIRFRSISLRVSSISRSWIPPTKVFLLGKPQLKTPHEHI